MAPFFFKELEGPEVLAGDGLFAWGISGQVGPTKKQYVNKWEVFAIPIFAVDRICCRDLTTCCHDYSKVLVQSLQVIYI